MEITPDKNFLAVASYQHIRMYDLKSNAIMNYESISKNVTSLGFQENGKWMYTGGEDTKARIWDLRTTNSPAAKQFQACGPVTCVRLHPNQGELFIGDQKGAIHRWDMKTDNSDRFVNLLFFSKYWSNCNRLFQIPEPDTMILDIAIDPDGTHMAAVTNKGRCYIWGLKTEEKDEPTQLTPKQKFDAHKRHILRCKFSPDST